MRVQPQRGCRLYQHYQVYLQGDYIAAVLQLHGQTEGLLEPAGLLAGKLAWSDLPSWWHTQASCPTHNIML